jgi:predicted nucleic acid-binding protein
VTPWPAYLVDSDVIILMLRGRARTIAFWNRLLEDGALGCSALSISDVLRGARPREREATQRLLDSLIVMPVGRAEAELAADLMRRQGPGFVDCHIAATALVHDLPTVTYNSHDFERNGVSLVDATGW